MKKAILHRKTALFYKTLNGAGVGDVLMSIIHTAELAKIDVFGYLVVLQRHHARVAEDPAAWMPWNYTTALPRSTLSSRAAAYFSRFSATSSTCRADKAA